MGKQLLIIRTGLAPLILLMGATLLPRTGGAAASGVTGGIVIFKEFSFDPDSQAQIANYTSFERFPSVDNVVTSAGETIRILPGQGPVYIPQPGDPASNAGELARAILAAERRFPQFASRLETMRRAWAALPKRAVAAQATPAASRPRAAPFATPFAPEPTPAGGPAQVLRTRSGAVFVSWTVTGVEGDTVVISHEDGISRVSISDLPDNLIGFPPDVVARAEALRAQEEAELRKAADRAAPHGADAAASPGKGR